MKTITIQVELCAEVPDDMDDDEIESITNEMDVDAIVIHAERDGRHRPVKGAKVTSYTTTNIFAD